MSSQNKFVIFLGTVSGVLLLALTLVAVGNIVGRAFGHPIPGTYEIVGWLAALSMGAGVAYTQVHRGHVNIDFLLNRAPVRLREGIQAIIYALSAVMFAVLVWKLYEYGLDKKESGSASMTLRAPVYPWIYAMAVVMAAMTGIVVCQLCGHVKRLIAGSSDHRHHLGP